MPEPVRPNTFAMKMPTSAAMIVVPTRMPMTMPVYLIAANLLVFAGLILLLLRLKRPRFSLAQQILAGLIAGVAFGFFLQIAYGENRAVVEGTLEWTNVLGASYIIVLGNGFEIRLPHETS